MFTFSIYCDILYIYISYRKIEFSLFFRYRIERDEYENHIVNLETKNIQNTQEIIKLQEELKKYSELKNEQPQNVTFNEDNLIEYKEKIEELITLLQNEGEKQEQLEEKLANMKCYIQELQDTLQVKAQTLFVLIN